MKIEQMHLQNQMNYGYSYGMKAILIAVAILASVASIRAQGVFLQNTSFDPNSIVTLDSSTPIITGDLNSLTGDTGTTPTVPIFSDGSISGLSIEAAPEPSPLAIALLSSSLIFFVSRFSRRFQIRSEQS